MEIFFFSHSLVGLNVPSSHVAARGVFSKDIAAFSLSLSLSLSEVSIQPRTGPDKCAVLSGLVWDRLGSFGIASGPAVGRLPVQSCRQIVDNGDVHSPNTIRRNLHVYPADDTKNVSTK